ncbi:MAG TPA: hypothetical protein GXX29_11105 [Firmicutes bacterium]|nr:hypothetical protein [Bacillota bacterium]
MCDKCGQRPATIIFKLMENNKKTEIHLCEECAKSQSELNFLHEPLFTFHDILAGLFEPGGLLTGSPMPQVKVKQHCPNCGLTFSDFRRLGQLGCGECYKTFAAQLLPIIRRIHGSTKHTGHLPGELAAAGLSRRLEDLRQKLREAIAQEAYERAAEIRDQIKALEAEAGAKKQ